MKPKYIKAHMEVAGTYAKLSTARRLQVGALIVNYFGHGGEDGLAKEFIYTKETATSLRNPNTLPGSVMPDTSNPQPNSKPTANSAIRFMWCPE